MTSPASHFFLRGFSTRCGWGIITAALLMQILPAQETVSRETFSEWTATDGEPKIDAETGSLTVPPGAQLSRFFTTDSVKVHLVTRPHFSSVPSDWATIELGPASLTFVRNADGGGMVLLADEPLDLPFDLSLDESGRSQHPLEFTLTFDRKRALAELSIEDVLFEIDATAPIGRIEVALSSGRSHEWMLESFDVTLDEEARLPGQPGKKGNGGDDDSSGGILKPVALSGDRSALRVEAVIDSRSLFQQDKDVEAEKALTDANRNPRNSAEWHLETANALVQVAYSTMREGNPRKAVQIALRALEHTEKASRKAARKTGASALVATADQTAAFIQERLLADYDAAKVLYQRAAALHPLGDAAKQVQRIDRINQEADRKSARGELSREEQP